MNRAYECRQRADECRRNAAQVTDDVLRGAYLDLARHWRTMAQQTELLEQKELGSRDADPHNSGNVHSSQYQTPLGALVRSA
jgi:hypothetical protein